MYVKFRYPVLRKSLVSHNSQHVLFPVTFASMSPVMHAALDGGQAPPVLLLNAAVSVLALLTLIVGGPLLEKYIPLPSTLEENAPKDEGWFDSAKRAGLELGLWKFLGTTANLYGLSLTTADHGAFLIQLTTLIVPVSQAILGVPIPQRIQVSVGLALAGVALFTQDVGGNPLAESGSSALGDALCVVAACFYATYDLRLFGWGKLIAARELITNKIAAQAGFSVLLLLAAGYSQSQLFLEGSNGVTLTLVALVAWSGIMVK
jgi:drug/metabolite transporter (DMT)-like permease